MDSFERAHVPRKPSSKLGNKPDDAVKRQLRQMMSAYKKGDNQNIRDSSEFKPKFDLEETLSISDFSEFSISKDADQSMGTVTSNTSDDSQSTSNENSSSKFNSLDNDEHTRDDSSENITECCEEFKVLSTSIDGSASTSFGNSSGVFECVESNDSSELSIPSFLQSPTGTDIDLSDDGEFDADGTLACKILENLGRKDVGNKRKIPKENVNLEIRKDVNQIKQKTINTAKNKKKTKKLKQETQNNSTEYFLEEDFSSDLDSKQIYLDLHEFKKESITKENYSTPKQSHPVIELSDESINNSMDSTSTSFSSPFISVSAENMSTQCLGDLIGDYVHPTIRNLPTEKQNIHTKNTISMFHTDTMIVKDVIDDEISSLVPEVDEELTIEDLNLDTDTQELIKESNNFNDIIPTEDMMETTIEDMTVDTIPIDSVEDNVPIDEVPITLYNGKDKHVLVMKHQSELYIHGKVQIADINGMVEIFGYKLNYDSIEVYAPYCNFAQCLKTLENPHQVNPDLFSELISVGLSTTDANEIVSTLEDNSAVVILSKLKSRGIDFVDNNFSTTDLFSKRGDNTPRFLKKAADSLGCSFYLKPPKKSFEEKVIWDEVYTSGREGSRGIICGGKGTGKSTFVRHYVNTLLAEGPVLVIDLDPGQAEFTVPGNISATIVEKPLIGPSFTHLKTPERMLNIGIINTMENASRYLSAVTDLVAFCRANEDFKDLPWIVNTMGLCNHMGLKFITSIIYQIQPTFLFQIDSKVPKKRFEVELDPLTVTQLYQEQYSRDRAFRNIQNCLLKYSYVIARHEENPSLKGNAGSGMLPRDERYLNILAHFGALLNDSRLQGLMEIVPYEVYLKDLNVGLNIKIPVDTVTKVINGKIIALCQQSSHDKGRVFTLRDKALLCHGHGLIRGIDFEQGLLYILTPTPISKLNAVDTLVYADWMPELRGEEGDLPSGTAIPYRTANTAHLHRKLMFPPRRRFNPLQLLKMTRNS